MQQVGLADSYKYIKFGGSNSQQVMKRVTKIYIII